MTPPVDLPPLPTDNSLERPLPPNDPSTSFEDLVSSLCYAAFSANDWRDKKVTNEDLVHSESHRMKLFAQHIRAQGGEQPEDGFQAAIAAAIKSEFNRMNQRFNQIEENIQNVKAELKHDLDEIKGELVEVRGELVKVKGELIEVKHGKLANRAFAMLRLRPGCCSLW